MLFYDGQGLKAECCSLVASGPSLASLPYFDTSRAVHRPICSAKLPAFSDYLSALHCSSPIFAFKGCKQNFFVTASDTLDKDRFHG